MAVEISPKAVGGAVTEKKITSARKTPIKISEYLAVGGGVMMLFRI
jgi:hypothetical protein